MKLQYTQGPWVLRDDRLAPQVWVEAKRGTTRIVRFGPRENWDAIDYGNARLIEAAPTMWEALLAEEALHQHIATCDAFDVPDGECDQCIELGAQARLLRRGALSKVREKA